MYTRKEKADAIASLKLGVYATTSWKSVVAMERTNQRLLKCMGTTLMPFGTDVVLCLAAALKLQGYTSAKNYINAAVIQAERKGAVLTDEIRRCVKDSIRSALRRI